MFIFLAGESQYFDEKKQVYENDFANISYDLNIVDGSNYSAKFRVVFDICDSKKVSLHCMFAWRKQNSNLSIVNWRPKNETTCFAKHDNLSISEMVFEIQISLPVRRSFSLMKLSIADGGDIFKTLRMFRLDVLCKCQFIWSQLINVLMIILNL